MYRKLFLTIIFFALTLLVVLSTLAINGYRTWQLKTIQIDSLNMVVRWKNLLSSNTNTLFQLKPFDVLQEERNAALVNFKTDFARFMNYDFKSTFDAELSEKVLNSKKLWLLVEHKIQATDGLLEQVRGSEIFPTLGLDGANSLFDAYLLLRDKGNSLEIITLQRFVDDIRAFSHTSSYFENVLVQLNLDIQHHVAEIVQSMFVSVALFCCGIIGFAFFAVTIIQKRVSYNAESAKAELEQHVQDRTEKLNRSIEELRRTQDHLVESEKMSALGKLVAGIAHEINTPIGVSLTAISYLDHLILQSKQLAGPGAGNGNNLQTLLDNAGEASSIALSNIQRAVELIQSFKQIAVDQTAELQRLFNLDQYLHEISISLRPLLKQNQHHIAIVCPDNINIFSFPGMISQIITNLVENAVIHAFQGRQYGSLAIEVSLQDDHVVLSVTDNGAGMTNEIQKHIFEPFFTTKRGQGGSGMGLHIVYNIVTQRLGGTIACRSTPDEGSCFTVTLPLNQETLLEHSQDLARF